MAKINCATFVYMAIAIKVYNATNGG